MADETPESLRVSPPGDGAGLRLRVWLACLAGPAVVALGIWWVLGMFVGPYTPAESSRAVIALLACAGAGLVIGTVFAVWLDTRLSAHARGLKQALSARDVESLAELPARAGWGARWTRPCTSRASSRRCADGSNAGSKPNAGRRWRSKRDRSRCSAGRSIAASRASRSFGSRTSPWRG